MSKLLELSKAYALSISTLGRLRRSGVNIKVPWMVAKAVTAQRTRPAAWINGAPFNPATRIPRGVERPPLVCSCDEEEADDGCPSCRIRWWYDIPDVN